MSRASNKNKKNKNKKPISQRVQEQQKEAKARRDLFASLEDADKHLNVLKANLHGFLKIGHDLFLTSNEWLFTEDVRVDGAKQADAIDDLLILRSYMFKLQQSLYKIITTQAATRELSNSFHKLTLEEIYAKYVSELIPIISSFGEEITEILGIADSLTQKYDEILTNVLPSEVYDSMKRIFKEAAENREAMREVNLTRAPEVQPEEVPTMEMSDEASTQSSEQSEDPAPQATEKEASQSEASRSDSELGDMQEASGSGSNDGCPSGDETHSQILPDAHPAEEQSDTPDTSKQPTVKVD